MNTDNLNEALNWNNLNYVNSANIPGNCYVWQALGTPKNKTNFHPRNIQQAGKWATCQYYNSLFIKLEKRRCTWNYEVAFRSFLPIHVISLGSSALRSMIQPLFTCLSFLGITFRNHIWALGGITRISKTISGKKFHRSSMTASLATQKASPQKECVPCPDCPLMRAIGKFWAQIFNRSTLCWEIEDLGSLCYKPGCQ